MDIVAVLALVPASWLALPYLPPGRGGLILILGGLSMLAAALSMLVVAPAMIPAGARAASGGMGRTAGRTQRGLEPKAPVKLRSWHKALSLGATSYGLTSFKIAYAQRRSCVVIVDACRSCRRGRNACGRERRTIARAARRLRSSARVQEISCRILGEARCAFAVELPRR